MTSALLIMGAADDAQVHNLYEQLVEDVQTQPQAQAGVTQISATADVPVAQIAKDPHAALEQAVTSIRSTEQGLTLVRGLVSSPVPSFDVTGWNLDVAAAVGAPVLYWLDAEGMSPELLGQEIATFASRAAEHNATLAGVVVSGPHHPEALGEDIPLFAAPLSQDDLAQVMGVSSTAVTPLMFKTNLLARAAADKQRIVLPEAGDERILRASAELLAGNVADIILIGEQASIFEQANSLGVDVSAATVISPTQPEMVAKYAQELAHLRSANGMTEEEATRTVQDPVYFGTMMVHMGDADGMVSGVAHTTADTIRPALQIIKTAPGISLVSSAFFMLLEDHALVFADCAVMVSPSAEELAQIAVASARTSAQFGVDPKVALLSYSTLGSGSGPSVDTVTQAVDLVREADPSLAVEGPLQFDAAVDSEVARSKAPGSTVAGAANVLVFPSLDAGNIAYKAIQRTAGAVAVGPVLQGLRKPVNDLSRGALVEDIVNTVAITAIQAQG